MRGDASCPFFLHLQEIDRVRKQFVVRTSFRSFKCYNWHTFLEILTASYHRRRRSSLSGLGLRSRRTKRAIAHRLKKRQLSRILTAEFLRALAPLL